MVDLPLTRYAEVDGLNIAFQVSGDGPRDLVWVPGMYSHVEALWDIPGHPEIMHRLGSFARVIGFDKRCTGMSDRTSSLPTLEERMRDIGAVMDAASSERAWLFGISEGGPLCLMYAAANPERVAGVALWGSYSRFCRGEDYPYGPARDEWMEWVRESTASWGDPAAVQGSLSVTAPSRVGDRDFAEGLARAGRLAFGPKAYVDLWKLAMDIDVRGLLPVVQVPVLIMHRTGDQVIPVEHGRFLAEHIPNGRLAEFPGDDHLAQTMDSAVLDTLEEFVSGQPPPQVPKTRTLAAVLFTDIVGSTSSATEHGDANWVKILDRHDRICVENVTRYGGRLVKSTGDGILATFGGPSQAVECGQALSTQLAARDLHIRAGVHLGEIELRGDDVGGVAVHVAARVMGLAQPDEVLVTRTVVDVVAGSGLAFTARGLNRLKGISEPWELHALARTS